MLDINEMKYTQLESLTDEELCALCAQENRLAEEILVARYHRLVRSCARPYFLAGGLIPENVETAVKQLAPFAVDASSSLETDGFKDKIKMTAFVKAVRKD